MRSQFSIRRRDNHALGVTLGRYRKVSLHTSSSDELLFHLNRRYNAGQRHQEEKFFAQMNDLNVLSKESPPPPPPNMSKVSKEMTCSHE